jgi:hypothetical protein
MTRRHEPEQHTRADRNQECKPPHTPVNSHGGTGIADSRNRAERTQHEGVAAGIQPQKHLRGQDANRETDRAPERGEHETLDEELSHETRASSSDGGANRHFALTRLRANEEKIGDVGARDEQ